MLGTPKHDPAYWGDRLQPPAQTAVAATVTYRSRVVGGVMLRLCQMWATYSVSPLHRGELLEILDFIRTAV